MYWPIKYRNYLGLLRSKLYGTREYNLKYGLGTLSEQIQPIWNTQIARDTLANQQPEFQNKPVKLAYIPLLHFA